jgi:anaerobic selenocysteine-containing dehydrogenase
MGGEARMSEVAYSFCRICNNHCSIKVAVEDGVATKVTGNRDNPLYGGYTCIKGRSQTHFLNSPERLLHSMKRDREGNFTPLPVSAAMDEIAERLAGIIAEHGPRSVAGYAGTMALANFATAAPMFTALLDGIGTPMRFDPNTLDKGGKQVAQSLLGTWAAPLQGFDRPKAILLLGINPLVTYTGFPAGSPHVWLTKVMNDGCQLIVVDPRRTDVAKRATLHLQPHPGHDVRILAAMIHVVLSENLCDQQFTDRHVRHVEGLRRAVAGFSPDSVAPQAGVTASDLTSAARMYATATRGYAMAGTGPNMSGAGTLLEYLVLVLETLCGRWLREGEVLKQAPTLLPGPVSLRAGARDPGDWRLPEPMRVRGLQQSRAGMPLAALSDEILEPGEGQVRALISWGGNPAVAFPDQQKTISALKSLSLLVSIDPWMSATARYADYVIAPTMPLESAAMTSMLDSLALRATGYGIGDAYAQYSPAVSRPPAGSDVIEDWRFFYGLIVRMGYQVKVRPAGATRRVPPVILDHEPDTEELLEIFASGSRVPLAAVRSRPGGDFFPDNLPVVGPPSERENGRLDVANPEMMSALGKLRTSILAYEGDDRFGYRLLCRRHNHTYNTSANFEVTNRGIPYNPAFMNPGDIDDLGIAAGDAVIIRSARSSIPAIAAADPDLRRGVVSMAFGYGPADQNRDVRSTGSSPSRLVPNDEIFDPYTGQPRMSNVPVAVEAIPDGRAAQVQAQAQAQVQAQGQGQAQPADRHS